MISFGVCSFFSPSFSFTFFPPSFPFSLSLLCPGVVPLFSFSPLFLFSFSDEVVFVVVVVVVVVLGTCARIQTISFPPLFKISVFFGSCLDQSQ